MKQYLAFKCLTVPDGNLFRSEMYKGDGCYSVFCDGIYHFVVVDGVKVNNMPLPIETLNKHIFDIEKESKLMPKQEEVVTISTLLKILAVKQDGCTITEVLKS